MGVSVSGKSELHGNVTSAHECLGFYSAAEILRVLGDPRDHVEIKSATRDILSWPA